MFGGVLSRLLGKSAVSAGDDIAANLAAQNSRSVLSDIGSTVAQQPRRSALQQIRNGVEKQQPVNPNIDPDSVLSGATDKALRGNKGLRNKAMNIGENIEDAGRKLRNNSILGTIRDHKTLANADDAIKWADQYGFNQNQYGDIADVLTGGDGILSKFNENALRNSQISTIIPSKSRENALKMIDRSIDLKDSQKKTLKQVLQGAEDNAVGNMGSRLGERGINRATAVGEADIYDLHRMVQDLESYAYNEVSGKGANAARKAIRSYTNDVKKVIDELSGEMYNNPDYVRELSEGLIGANLSPQLTKDILGKVRSGNLKYSDVRSLQRPAVTLGRISQSAKEAPLSNSMAGAAGGGLLGGAVGQVTNEVVGKPLAAATGKILQGAGRATQVAAGAGGAGGGGGINPLVAGGLGLGGVGVLSNLMGGGNSGGAPAMAAAGLGGNQASALGQRGMYEDGTPVAEAEPTVGGYNRSQLEGAYISALMDNNVKAADAIGSMIDMLDNNEARATKKKESSSSSSKSENALNKIAALEGLFNQSGGARGAMGAVTGLLNNVTFGMANPAQSAYEAQRQAAAVALARAAGDTGALSNQDIQGYMAMLPSPSDSGQAAQLKLEAIYSQLGM